MFTMRSQDSLMMSSEDHYTCEVTRLTNDVIRGLTTHVYNDDVTSESDPLHMFTMRSQDSLTCDVIRGPLHMFTMRSQDSLMMSSEDHCTHV